MYLKTVLIISKCEHFLFLHNQLKVHTLFSYPNPGYKTRITCILPSHLPKNCNVLYLEPNLIEKKLSPIYILTLQYIRNSIPTQHWSPTYAWFHLEIKKKWNTIVWRHCFHLKLMWVDLWTQVWHGKSTQGV